MDRGDGQALGPATEKARRPNLLHQCRGSTRIGLWLAKCLN